MSKTMDELCDVFGQASGAEYERWLYDKRSDHVALAAGPALAMRRAGIAAVVRALRDHLKAETPHWSDGWGIIEVENEMNEILGDAGEKVAGGSSSNASGPVCGHTAPATASAPAVCEWIDQVKGMAWAGCNKKLYPIKSAVNGCNGCGKPIKFTEAKP